MAACIGKRVTIKRALPLQRRLGAAVRRVWPWRRHILGLGLARHVQEVRQDASVAVARPASDVRTIAHRMLARGRLRSHLVVLRPCRRWKRKRHGDNEKQSRGKPVTGPARPLYPWG